VSIVYKVTISSYSTAKLHKEIRDKSLTPEWRDEDDCEPVEEVKACHQGQAKQPEPEQQVHLPPAQVIIAGEGLPPGSGQTTRTRAAGTPATSTGYYCR
jgi:hypothetical protein